MSKQPPPTPAVSATDPCPTIIQISVGRRETVNLPSTFAPPDPSTHSPDKNPCDFPFKSLVDVALLKRGLLLKKRICKFYLLFGLMALCFVFCIKLQTIWQKHA